MAAGLDEFVFMQAGALLAPAVPLPHRLNKVGQAAADPIGRAFPLNVGHAVPEVDGPRLAVARGMASNTVIIYTSGNGYFLGDRGLAGKWFMYEESLRDPLTIYDPRQPAANRACDENAMTLNIDFAPTMLNIAGIAPPAGMQDRSLMPFVENKLPSGWRTQFFYEHHFGPQILPPSEGVRTGRYTYIRWVDEQPPIEELYDLKTDPLKGHNLAADSAHAQLLAKLRAQWEKYREDLK